MSEINYVTQQAQQWARQDPWQQWISEAPDAAGRVPLDDELIRDYLGNNNPFPDGSTVDVASREEDGSAWETAVVRERIGTDEWLVEYTDDGYEGYRDHRELRPHS